jgi:transcriptional repressor NrdR
MICPYCKSKNTKVVDKRDSEDSITRRRRECIACERRFTTYEKVEKSSIKVIKKDGTLQTFDKDKVIRGIRVAAQKRLEDKSIESLADEIEIKILARKSSKIPASDIGRLILNRLKKIDEISYLRFASVFLGFEGLDDFRDAIKKIEKQ